ncbi:interleukin-20-like [Ascaphus truei]|uniref:interleukin-20-like n=1 Tax=Ascaphus truei TaxID=8439 RepID=UPI003F5A4C11
MGALFWCLCLVLIGFLLMKMPSTEANMGQCPITVDIHEFKRYFEAVREILHNEDTVTEVSLLKTSVLNQIHSSERCGFLLTLGRFYLNNIFPNLEFTPRETHRGINRLANSILGMKIELKHCHATMRCPCGEQSHRIIEGFKKEFYKLDTKAATLKAIGDLNILFRWMEKNLMG